MSSSASSPTALSRLEAQALEVIPEDLHLVGGTVPVGDLEGPNASTETRAQLVGDDPVRRFAGRDEHLRGLYERQLAQRRFFVQRAFLLAFPVEGEVRVH